MGKSKYKRKRLQTYGEGHPTPITMAIVQSEAYKVLKPTDKLVLADALRAYFRVSHWDTDPPKTGFTYTWSQCNESVSQRCFYEAMRKLCAIGFFETPPAIQETKPNAPKRYKQSPLWATYTASTRERADMAMDEAKKQARLSRDVTRRTAFREKATIPKVVDTTLPKVVDRENVLAFRCAKK